MKSERLPYLDYARVFVAYLVIFGHLLPGGDMVIRPYIYSFHMPFFFLVSGILHKYNGLIQWNKYFRSLLIPFAVWNILFLLLNPIMIYGDIWNGDISNYDFFNYFVKLFYVGFGKIIIGKDCIDQPTWFLISLFWCKIFTDFVKRKRVCLLFYLIIYFLSFYCNLLFIGNACMAFPFYYVGFLIKDTNYSNRKVMSNVVLSIMLLTISLILTNLNGRVSMLLRIFGQYPNYISFWLFYFNGFVGSFGILYFSMLFNRNQIVKKTATSLITILCAQYLFVLTFKHFNGWWNSVYNELWISLIIMFICVVFHDYLSKYFPLFVGSRFSNKLDK